MLSTEISRIQLFHYFIHKSKAFSIMCSNVTEMLHNNRLGYDDVVGNSDTKTRLRRLLEFTQPSMRERLSAFGGSMTLGGVLLHGPPGNSKTRFLSHVSLLPIDGAYF